MLGFLLRLLRRRVRVCTAQRGIGDETAGGRRRLSLGLVIVILVIVIGRFPELFRSDEPSLDFYAIDGCRLADGARGDGGPW